MLFFILFALCFAQTTEYCYTQIKSGNDVVGYEKVPKGTAACAQGATTTAPQLTGDYVCIDTGKLCGDGSDNKVTGTKCVMVNKCVVLVNTNEKYTIENNKVKVTPYTSATCEESSAVANEIDNYDCGSCNDKGDADDKYTCHKATEPACTAENQATKCATHADGKKCIVDTANAQNNKCGCQAATDCAAGQECSGNKCIKIEYCYVETKSDGKTIGYQKERKDGECSTNFKVGTADPKIDGSYVCVNEGTGCKVEGASFTKGTCIKTGVCYQESDTKSYKYYISDGKVDIETYGNKNCDGKATESQKKCDECGKEGEVHKEYKCGAFETAILMVIAFIFFLF